MARGWESKSVEEQQSQSDAGPSGPRVRLTPVQAEARRRKESLQLARKHILRQLETVHNPFHRKALEDALADLEARLSRPD
jgi:hypothetical protein